MSDFLWLTKENGELQSYPVFIELDMFATTDHIFSCVDAWFKYVCEAHEIKIAKVVYERPWNFPLEY